MGRKSLDKGKRGELEAAKELARLFDCEAHRGRQYFGSQESPDVRTDIPEVHIEVKRTESLRMWAALKQARDESGGDVPLVLHRANGKPWVAIIELNELPRLVTQLYLTMMANK